MSILNRVDELLKGKGPQGGPGVADRPATTVVPPTPGSFRELTLKLKGAIGDDTVYQQLKTSFDAYIDRGLVSRDQGVAMFRRLASDLGTDEYRGKFTAETAEAFCDGLQTVAEASANFGRRSEQMAGEGLASARWVEPTVLITELTPPEDQKVVVRLRQTSGGHDQVVAHYVNPEFVAIGDTRLQDGDASRMANELLVRAIGKPGEHPSREVAFPVLYSQDGQPPMVYATRIEVQTIFPNTTIVIDGPPASGGKWRKTEDHITQHGPKTRAPEITAIVVGPTTTPAIDLTHIKVDAPGAERLRNKYPKGTPIRFWGAMATYTTSTGSSFGTLDRQSTVRSPKSHFNESVEIQERLDTRGLGGLPQEHY